MIDPRFLCDKHLLGEHGELHKFLPSFFKKYKVDKRIEPVVQIELSSYLERHDELATEMKRRGMNHNSPIKELPDFSYLPSAHYNAVVDKEVSVSDLRVRCEGCRERLHLYRW